MKDVTREFIKYTHRRKANLEAAKSLEKMAEKKPVSRIVTQTPIRFPRITPTPRIEVANILYQRPKTLVKKVAKALGQSGMSQKEVGERTFDYYVENEGVD